MGICDYPRGDSGPDVAGLAGTDCPGTTSEQAVRIQGNAEEMTDLKDLIPSGAQTYSKARDRYPVGAPIRANKARGPYVYAEDADGKLGEYWDCVSALGAVILGHCDPGVMEAVKIQLHRGTSLSLPTELEQALSQKLVDLVPGMDMCRFGKNGCDVTGAAVRIARAHTGRDQIIYSQYHGHHDWCMGYPPKIGGVPRAMQVLSTRLTLEFQWDPEKLEALFFELQPAAFVVEPVPSVNPVLPPLGYWEDLRERCSAHGVLLVLDEMVTAFRLGFPGAVTEWGIEPDLWCGAKALGNGHPITCLLGRRKLMELIDGPVFYSTTFAGEATAMAAALATLAQLELRGPPKTVGRLFADALRRGINTYGLDLEVVGYDARPVVRGPDAGVFGEAMIQEGFLWQGYLNATWAHAGVIVDMCEGLERAFKRVGLADREG